MHLVGPSPQRWEDCVNALLTLEKTEAGRSWDRRPRSAVPERGGWQAHREPEPPLPRRGNREVRAGPRSLRSQSGRAGGGSEVRRGWFQFSGRGLTTRVFENSKLNFGSEPREKMWYPALGALPTQPGELGFCIARGPVSAAKELVTLPAALEPRVIAGWWWGRELGSLGPALMNLKGLDLLGSSRNSTEDQGGAVRCGDLPVDMNRESRTSGQFLVRDSRQRARGRGLELPQGRPGSPLSLPLPEKHLKPSPGRSASE